ncbi:MAG: gliding motility-associated C-terminal domain-containing protein [Bacteroidetes bacterium]|nr:gliding motility-associated C-terminal domain-containing protein [Bacteroidota bacterium]MBS1633317.1 gliding motility-associated C-terminal domain-containing protein [Bacteroidota bacterium]
MAIFASMQAMAQLPPRQWALHYGGGDVDIPFVVKVTGDGGTIVGGYTDSKDGDVSPQPNRDYWDLWLVKLDKCGTIQWERSFGGTGYESARDIAQTSDGGYIVLGETNSTDGGVVAGFGGTKDIWLLKLTASGTLQWQKRYGGSGLDIGNHIEITSDGGFLIAASSSSNDGDITGNHGTGGYTDGVLMKISATGAVQWSKCFGGSKNEELFDFRIINGTTYLAGFTNSTDGDIPPDQKNYDVWLLAIDANGNKVFSKIYGGSQNDVAYCLTQGTDGSLTLAGYTTSNDGDVSGAKGSQDYWVLNVDQKGKLNWQKVLGGTDAEYAKTIITDKDSSYIVGGITYSNDGDVTGSLGKADYWTVKLSTKGTVIWKNNWGGSNNDNLRYMIRNSETDEYYLAGDSESGDGDFSSSLGETDFGIIKLKLPELKIKDSAVCDISSFIAKQDTIRDICGNDSVLVNYNPILLNGPFNNIRKQDTVFTGQSITLHANGNGTIFWTNDPTLSCTACTDPVATPLTTTTYTATNYLSDGCQVPDKFTVVVLKDAVVMMPNAFTPNSDGLNDYFGPIGKVPDGYKLQLYNRNGEIVFRSSSVNQRWNGMYNGKLQPTSVFIYLIDYKDLQNKPHQQKGTFMLIR